MSPKCSQEAPRGPQLTPRWPRDGPKMAPRWPQDGPKMAQDASKMPQDTRLSPRYVNIGRNTRFPYVLTRFYAFSRVFYALRRILTRTCWQWNGKRGHENCASCRWDLPWKCLDSVCCSAAKRFPRSLLRFLERSRMAPAWSWPPSVSNIGPERSKDSHKMAPACLKIPTLTQSKPT